MEGPPAERRGVKGREGSLAPQGMELSLQATLTPTQAAVLGGSCRIQAPTGLSVSQHRHTDVPASVSFSSHTRVPLPERPLQYCQSRRHRCSGGWNPQQ